MKKRGEKREKGKGKGKGKGKRGKKSECEDMPGWEDVKREIVGAAGVPREVVDACEGRWLYKMYVVCRCGVGVVGLRRFLVGESERRGVRRRRSVLERFVVDGFGYGWERGYEGRHRMVERAAVELVAERVRARGKCGG